MREKFDYAKWIAGLKAKPFAEELARAAAAYDNGKSHTARQYRAALDESLARRKGAGVQIGLFG